MALGLLSYYIAGAPNGPVLRRGRRPRPPSSSRCRPGMLDQNADISPGVDARCLRCAAIAGAPGAAYFDARTRRPEPCRVALLRRFQTLPEARPSNGREPVIEQRGMSGHVPALFRTHSVGHGRRLSSAGLIRFGFARYLAGIVLGQVPADRHHRARWRSSSATHRPVPSRDPVRASSYALRRWRDAAASPCLRRRGTVRLGRGSSSGLAAIGSPARGTGRASSAACRPSRSGGC